MELAELDDWAQLANEELKLRSNLLVGSLF